MRIVLGETLAIPPVLEIELTDGEVVHSGVGSAFMSSKTCVAAIPRRQGDDLFLEPKEAGLYELHVFGRTGLRILLIEVEVRARRRRKG